jgi:hypothetical protein
MSGEFRWGLMLLKKCFFFYSEHGHPLTTKTLETRSRYETADVQQSVHFMFTFPVRPGSRIKGGLWGAR